MTAKALQQTYFNGFQPELFQFFKQLKKNNNRDWFQSHKALFKETVQLPLVDFVTDIAPEIHKLSKQYLADPRLNGGSIFRIHKDVRFSKDKSPYKEHAACQFRHQLKNDVHAPGFYMHLAPEEVFFGAGIWAPPSDGLFKIRTAIVEKPAEWKKARAAIVKSGYFDGIEGEGLKRAPKGFDLEHPLIEDIRRKHFLVMRRVDESFALQEDFLSEVVATYKASVPLMKFLCKALEIPF